MTKRRELMKGRKPTKENKALNQRYFAKSVGGVVTSAPSNGHCPSSPRGAHWWMTAPPDGKVSVGVCKYCGTRREFLNWIEAGYNR